PLVNVRSDISTTVPIFEPESLEPSILRNYKLSHIIPYLNWQMLLGKHLGIQGKVSRLLEEGDEKTVALKERIDEFLIQAQEENLVEANGVYQFFPAQADGNDILIYDPTDKKSVIERFTFPRQQKAPHLCLADFLRPVS